MARKIDPILQIDDRDFEYLKLQKGKLHDLINDKPRWLIAYEHDLYTTYQEILPFLPDRCWGVLDVGSGLGGIDVLLSRHYGPHLYITLLDGEKDPPKMELHRKTFNDMRVARSFHVRNGLREDRFGYLTPKAACVMKPFDLIVSFGSWCFHYPPHEYLPLIIGGGASHRDTVLIMDVRTDKPEYTRELGQHFDCVDVIRRSAKFNRTVFRRLSA